MREVARHEVITTGDLALKGMRVLDFSHLAAGPWCTMMLADLGAEVIKIEPPETGEFARTAGSIYVQGESAVFLALNRNKKSLAISLKTEAGRSIVHKLIATADVVVENFRPGTVKRLGIDYETVQKINPRIVYCSISAFGQTGPYVEQPANDPVIQAISGTMAMNGTASGEPVRMGVPVPDFAAGMLSAYGIVSALLYRERTGKGQKVDLSLLDAQLFTAGPRAEEALLTGEAPPSLGSAHPSFAPYQAYLCSDDKYIYVACINDKFWLNLCAGLERTDLAKDPRFATNPDRCANREMLDEVLVPIFAARTRQEWLHVLEAAWVPCGPVNKITEAFNDPQVIHNQVVVTVHHPKLGEIPVLNNPLRFSQTPPQIRLHPPLLGEQGSSLLAELGYTEADVAALRREGVVG